MESSSGWSCIPFQEQVTAGSCHPPTSVFCPVVKGFDLILHTNTCNLLFYVISYWQLFLAQFSSSAFVEWFSSVLPTLKEFPFNSTENPGRHLKETYKFFCFFFPFLFSCRIKWTHFFTRKGRRHLYLIPNGIWYSQFEWIPFQSGFISSFLL